MLRHHLIISIVHTLWIAEATHGCRFIVPLKAVIEDLTRHGSGCSGHISGS
jgi:hypothetical protein